jgi:hypothetical protein
LHTPSIFSFKLYTLFLVFVMFPTAILSQEYGLNFKGQSYLLDERTGLEISPNKYVDVKNEFEVSFDLKVDFKKKKK